MATNPGQDPQGYPKLDIKAARALNPHVRTIQIQSILGGKSHLSHFPAQDQFYASLGIDPSLPQDEPFVSQFNVDPSGLIRPTPLKFGGFGVLQPKWIVNNPKTKDVFVYGANGSTYSLTTGFSLSGLSDGGSMSSATGNGAEYYDNYIYFAKNTDIARYGPLDGSAAFDGTYWTSTLSKAALTNTTYPEHEMSNYGAWGTPFLYPNHILHRHSDGKLYVADVVGNQGTLHIISTTKTTVEGDTDNGSAANKLQFGYGLWPTAVETYGSSLVVALFEGVSSNTALPKSTYMRAKIAFWDTTSQSFNSITWVEYPDSYISAIKNVDGVLYFISGNPQVFGFRVMQYVGGSSFKEVEFFSDGVMPPAGAVAGFSTQLFFGTNTFIPEPAAVVYSLGLPGGISKGLFTVLSAGDPLNGSKKRTVTSLTVDANNLYGGRRTVMAGIADQVTTGDIVIQDYITLVEYGAVSGGITTPCVWWSGIFKIGQPFKITKIRIPLVSGVIANQILTPKVFTDDGNGVTYTGGTANGLPIINFANYPAKQNIVLRPENLTGAHNFWLELRWTGTATPPPVVSLPITIEYELIAD